MATGQQLIEAFAALRGLRYRLDPPPDPRDGTVDCSLATLLAMEAVGLRPPGVRTAEQIRQVLTPIREDEVKPGDIIFFQDTYDAAGPAGPDGRIASHLGVSLGRGTLQMWDANETGHHPPRPMGAGAVARGPAGTGPERRCHPHLPGRRELGGGRGELPGHPRLGRGRGGGVLGGHH
jgi:hypothetical protein